MLNTHLNSMRMLTVAAAIGLLGAAVLTAPPSGTPTQTYIAQGASLAGVKAAVVAAGGEITHELGIIRAVGARLTPNQYENLRAATAVQRLYENRSAETAKKPNKNSTTADTHGTGSFKGYTEHPAQVGADRLHAEGLLGEGVTLAVLDSGLHSSNAITKNSSKRNRLLAHYDATTDRLLGKKNLSDKNGHGTHVTSIVADPSADGETSRFNGIAPDVSLLALKAFDENGQGSYADVIRGLDWLVANKDVYNIRVLNLSFSAPPQSHYWDDPLNQAVMAAWQAGIVVVASAGNTGPEPMTIGVPGNVPYVITVGAMTDNYTPDDPSDDTLASFSSVGPTVEGFVKSEVMAPGGHIHGMMDNFDRIAKDHPEFHDGGQYFTMSGTSQSAAVVSGVAALILQADPTLSPDDVKCRLMASATGARNEDGSPRYSILQQGSGLVDAYEAVYSTALGCANRGLDIAKDLAGDEHYAGLVRRDADGNYYFDVIEGQSMLWGDSML